ncbi:hypothetical protein ACHAWF_010511 [Thalassiosira exigua]
MGARRRRPFLLVAVAVLSPVALPPADGTAASDHSFCGMSWSDASSNCDDRRPCPRSTDDECATESHPDHVCFADTLCDASLGHGSKYRYAYLAPVADAEHADPSNVKFCGSWWGGAEEKCAISTHCPDGTCPGPGEHCFETKCHVQDLLRDELGEDWKEVVRGEGAEGGLETEEMAELSAEKKMTADDPRRNSFCGTTWSDASSACSDWCRGDDRPGDCPDGRTCFADTICYYDEDLVPTASPLATPPPTGSPVSRSAPLRSKMDSAMGLFAFRTVKWTVPPGQDRSAGFSQGLLVRIRLCHWFKNGNLDIVVLTKGREICGNGSSRPEAMPPQRTDFGRKVASEAAQDDPSNKKFCGASWALATQNCSPEVSAVFSCVFRDYAPDEKKTRCLACLTPISSKTHCAVDADCPGSDDKCYDSLPGCNLLDMAPSPSAGLHGAPGSLDPENFRFCGTGYEDAAANCNLSRHCPDLACADPSLQCFVDLNYVGASHCNADDMIRGNTRAPTGKPTVVSCGFAMRFCLGSFAAATILPTVHACILAAADRPTDGKSNQSSHSTSYEDTPTPYPTYWYTYLPTPPKSDQSVVDQMPTVGEKPLETMTVRPTVPKSLEGVIPSKKRFFCGTSMKELEQSCDSALECNPSTHCPPGLGCIRFDFCKKPQPKPPNSALWNPDLCPLGFIGKRSPVGDCQKYFLCDSGFLKASYTCDLGFLFDNGSGECLSQEVVNSSCEYIAPPDVVSGENQPDEPVEAENSLQLGTFQDGQTEEYQSRPDSGTYNSIISPSGTPPVASPSGTPPVDGTGQTNTGPSQIAIASDPPAVSGGGIGIIPESDYDTGNFRPDLCPVGFNGMNTNEDCTNYYECTDGYVGYFYGCESGFKYDKVRGHCISNELVNRYCYGPAVNYEQDQGESQKPSLFPSPVDVPVPSSSSEGWSTAEGGSFVWSDTASPTLPQNESNEWAFWAGEMNSSGGRSPRRLCSCFLIFINVSFCHMTDMVNLLT